MTLSKIVQVIMIRQKYGLQGAERQNHDLRGGVGGRGVRGVGLIFPIYRYRKL